MDSMRAVEDLLRGFYEINNKSWVDVLYISYIDYKNLGEEIVNLMVYRRNLGEEIYDYSELQLTTYFGTITIRPHYGDPRIGRIVCTDGTKYLVSRSS
jgi:hypothetical protein